MVLTDGYFWNYFSYVYLFLGICCIVVDFHVPGLLRTVEEVIFGCDVVRHVSPLFSDRFALISGVLQSELYLFLGI